MLFYNAWQAAVYGRATSNLFKMTFLTSKIVGVDDAEGPPVSIPNTEVKLSGAEDSALATMCENREMPTQGESQIFLHSSVGSVTVTLNVRVDFNELLDFSVIMG